MSISASGYYLELEKNHVLFDPVSSVTNVFFDDLNKQVCIADGYLFLLKQGDYMNWNFLQQFHCKFFIELP